MPRLIAIDGIDGSGKSTAVGGVIELHPEFVLVSKNTRSRDNTPVAEYYNRLTDLIFTRPKAFGPQLSDSHWFRILSAWFLVQYQEVIEPNLTAGRTVLLDNAPAKYMMRYVVNSPTAEAYVRACFEECLSKIDLCIILAANAEVSLARKGGVFTAVEAGRGSGSDTAYIEYQSLVGKALSIEATSRRSWHVVECQNLGVNELVSRIEGIISSP